MSNHQRLRAVLLIADEVFCKEHFVADVVDLHPRLADVGRPAAPGLYREQKGSTREFFPRMRLGVAEAAS